MNLTCGCCGARFSARQHWNYDHGFGRCRSCCEWIIGRGEARPDHEGLVLEAEIVRIAMRDQWPAENDRL
jgi:hypothetical protein